MNINIPENYREEFDRAVDFALDKEYFTPKELAEYLEKSVLVASIMIGYMEKAGLITEGKNDEVRHTLITKGNWQSIGGKIENFTPPPKEEKKTFTPVILDKTAVDLSDIFEEAFIFGKIEVSYLNPNLFFSGEEVCPDEIQSVLVEKGGLFKKGQLIFTLLCGDEKKIPLKKKEFDKALRLKGLLDEKLGLQY